MILFCGNPIYFICSEVLIQRLKGQENKKSRVDSHQKQLDQLLNDG